MQSNLEIETDLVNFQHSFSRSPAGDFMRHCHSFYEMYYFVRGKVSYLVEGRQYLPSPHSLLLLAPQVFHGVRVEGDEPYERYALHFLPGAVSSAHAELLLSPFTPEKSHRDIYYEQMDSLGMQAHFDAIGACSALSGECRDTLLQIRIENLLSQVVTLDRRVSGPSVGGESPVIARVLGYLQAHMQESLSLDRLAEQFYINKYYLNTLFKKATGTTVMDYVIHKRVTAAHQYLCEGLPPAEAAEKAGFNGYSTFFRAYKKIYRAPPSAAASLSERQGGVSH